MLERWFLRATLGLWAGLVGPIIGFIAGQRLIGPDCQLSPTAGADIANAFSGAAAALREALPRVPLRTLLARLTQGGLRMPTDPLTLLLWLLLAVLALAALAGWLHNRYRPNPVPGPVPEPTAVEPTPPAELRRGRESKLAIGSAGIKSIVREGRMEEAYQVRAESETAFEAYADFDKQQERVALANRSPVPDSWC